jgi:hypothetical protein
VFRCEPNNTGDGVRNVITCGHGKDDDEILVWQSDTRTMFKSGMVRKTKRRFRLSDTYVCLLANQLNTVK